MSNASKKPKTVYYVRAGEPNATKWDVRLAKAIWYLHDEWDVRIADELEEWIHNVLVYGREIEIKRFEHAGYDDAE